MSDSEQKSTNDLEETKEAEARPSSGGLVVEPKADGEVDNFELQLEQTLRETEEAVLGLQEVAFKPDEIKSWQSARTIVNDFRPVPWFIWRLSNYVFGKSGHIAEISEGLIFGLRRLMFAAASDHTLGVGKKVNNMRETLKILPSDIIAAVGVIHAICRRLGNKPHDRIWRPILDDALLRARLGVEVGRLDPSYGAGRGMLAGFAGRCGLVILIATGELEEARAALEMLATGSEIREVGMVVYKADPLQVSAMVLSAAGCGRDSAFGTVSYASEKPVEVVSNDEQMKWLAAFTIIENVRMGKVEDIDDQMWKVLQFQDDQRKDLLSDVKKVIRRGHGWNWLI